MQILANHGSTVLFVCLPLPLFSRDSNFPVNKFAYIAEETALSLDRVFHYAIVP